MMSYLPPINMIVDLVKNTLSTLKKQSKKSLKDLMKAPIATIDKQIKDTEEEINNMKKEIEMTKSM
jgi:chaperonin cofactor prefoldin